MGQMFKLFFKRTNVSCRPQKHTMNPGNPLIHSKIADKYILAIALDWITGNLYGVNHAGDVFVCNTEAGDSLKCANILRRQGRLHGIAVDPDQGYGFLHYFANVILRAKNVHVSRYKLSLL